MVNQKYGDYHDPNNQYYQLIPYLQDYVETLSETSKKQVFLKIVEFYLYCKNELQKNILEVNGVDIITYFKNVVNVRDIQKKSKTFFRRIISSYYNYVIIYKKDIENIEFQNPVPSPKIYDFDGKNTPLEVLFEVDQEITLGLIERILHHVYYTKPVEIFIALSLIVYTGARISEIAGMDLSKIDLKNRWFITQVKSKKSNKRDGIYFIPDFFIPELDHYIKLLKEEHPRARYLFHSSRTNRFHTPRYFQYHLEDISKELDIKTPIHPHVFRDFLNTKRFDMGCKTALRKLLINQTVRDVNIKHYLKKYQNRLKLREIYDKFNPFQTLIKPIPKL